MTRTYLALPLAGGEVKDLVSADLRRVDIFAAKVVAKHSIISRNNPTYGRQWFYWNGAGDYLGRPDNSSDRTVWRFNQVNSNGIGAVATWFGYPVRVAKISNFMVGYAARKIGVTSLNAWISQALGTSNDSAASASWNMGWTVGGGESYEAVTPPMVKSIWNQSDSKNQKLWPNPSPVDNHISADSITNYDRQFCSPGFLEIINP